jgi:hypothetical protein
MPRQVAVGEHTTMSEQMNSVEATIEATGTRVDATAASNSGLWAAAAGGDDDAERVTNDDGDEPEDDGDDEDEADDVTDDEDELASEE